ncbi:MAG TPA: SurA N-terminal domain-containing protein [Methyloceanibacter sp.]|nr:SurA N-terminal domain-containing protein [Methyloceanibacter sp.]
MDLTATTSAAQRVRHAALLLAMAFAMGALGTSLGLGQEVSIKVLVNDDPISDYDISQRERFLALTTKAQPSPELKKKSTDLLIDERLQIQAGRELGYTADEEEVNKVLSDMASKNNLDLAGLTKALGSAGVNVKTLKDRVRAQLVWQDVVRRKFRHQVQIGDVDVDRALESSDEDGATQSSLQLRQIRLALSSTDQRAVAAKLAAAEALRARFTSCGGVADLAKGIDGASVRTIPEQQSSTLPQPARLLVQNAKAGQMTPPTISRSGVELYAVCGKRSATGDTNIRETTQRKLLGEEMMIRAERLLRDLRQDAFIEYR